MDQQQPNNEAQLLDRSLEKARIRAGFDPAVYNMLPLSVDALLVGVPCPADLLLPMANPQTQAIRMEVASRAGRPFQDNWLSRLRQAGIKYIFVDRRDSDGLKSYFRQNADAILDNDNLSLKKRAVVIQEMTALNMRQFMETGGEEPDPAEVSIGVRNTKETVERMMDHPQLLTRLAETLRSDYCIYTHSVNVCMLAMAFGTFMGLNRARIQALGIGAMLHDVGMSAVPKAITDKPHELDSSELAVVRTHPRKGYQMLLHVGAVPYDSLMIVLHHHEAANGTGYPGGLPAERTPMPARLVHLCDAFDAMTSQRPHHDPMSAYDAAARLIEASREQFGDDLVSRFVRFLASDFVR